MKALAKLIILIVISTFGSCDEDKNAVSDEQLSAAPDNLKTGGLYLIKGEGNAYHLTKILAIDDFAVHLRTYADTFKTRPENINSENLKVLIGHAPLDKNGFLSSEPDLLIVEGVKDSELEGYKMYLEAMNN